MPYTDCLHECCFTLFWQRSRFPVCSRSGNCIRLGKSWMSSRKTPLAFFTKVDTPITQDEPYYEVSDQLKRNGGFGFVFLDYGAHLAR